jgi:hypothetical protein
MQQASRQKHPKQKRYRAAAIKPTSVNNPKPMAQPVAVAADFDPADFRFSD